MHCTPKALLTFIVVAGLLIGERTITPAMAAPTGQASPNGGDRENVLRSVRSRNFHILTDLSQEDAEALLVRLETMLRLVGAYWGRPHRGVIQMYVAEDFRRWPAEQIATMDPNGVRSIRDGGGLTISKTVVSGNAFQAHAVVYAVAEGGTPQHEAVHAYCSHTFGTCGPVWYSEGMAEVGCYWQEQDDKSVRAPKHVIRYLQNEEPKPLQAIVDNPLETSGDSWQNYAWRWALCHLLGHNENYSRRFKPLGLQLLDLSARNVSFWQIYGGQAAEIEFEYRIFLKDIEPGYRVDLCSWDWKTKFVGSRGGRPLVSKIAANRGWQASRLRVIPETEYEYLAEGDWTLAEDADPVDADGSEDGTGRLVGAILSDNQLGEPFELGATGLLTVPMAGDLYLRCQDGWGDLADNSGTITVRMKSADRGSPLSARKLAKPPPPSADPKPADGQADP